MAEKRKYKRQILPFREYFRDFQKKTQKTPSTEIERAERIKKKYFETKAALNKKKRYDKGCNE